VSAAFEQAARDGGFHTPELMAELAAGVALAGHDEVPSEVRRRFATAHDVSAEWHVRMQAAFQASTDLAVSKTVNLPQDATAQQIGEVFVQAHVLGCKGVTVYRDGSHLGQVLAHDSRDEQDGVTPTGNAAAAATEPYRRHLPDEREAITHKFRVGEQEGYLTVGLYDDGSPGEIFVKIAKEGSTVSGLIDAVALLTSISLQYGVSLTKLADKLEHTRFEPHGPTGNPDIPLATSVLDYIFRWLRLHFDDEVAATIEHSALGSAASTAPATPPAPRSGLTCPDCGLQLDYLEQCLVCRACGYTRCG
jgi:ribonucleoside-diphosphate reductase alpha chain